MTKTAEERREKSKLLNRIRRAKIKNDPELYEKEKKKERERWAKRVAEGKIKKMHERSLRERKSLRKYYRDRSKESYQKKKNLALQEESVVAPSDEEMRHIPDPLASSPAVSLNTVQKPPNATASQLKPTTATVSNSPMMSDASNIAISPPQSPSASILNSPMMSEATNTAISPPQSPTASILNSPVMSDALNTAMSLPQSPTASSVNSPFSSQSTLLGTASPTCSDISQNILCSSAPDTPGCSSPIQSKFADTPKSSISQRLRSRMSKSFDSSTDESNPQTPKKKSFSRTIVFKKYKYRVNKEFKLLHHRLAELQKKNDAYKKTIHRLRVKNNIETAASGQEEIESSNKEDDVGSINYEVQSIADKLKSTVELFYDDDENSRMCPGKRDFVKKNKIRKQKRYLNETLATLHKKFLIRYPEHKISYSLFCRLRPFWVRIPNVQERETCLCQTHENFELVVLALHKNKILSEPTARHIIEKICCDPNNIFCLKRQCSKCKNKTITYLEFENLHKIDYMVWEKQKKTYTKNGVEKLTTQTAKHKKSILPKELIEVFEKLLFPYMGHIANIISQYRYIIKIKSELTEGQCIIHCDFSQNYCTKYANEIQSFHFAGSRQQITLHTSVLYYKSNGKLMTQSFFTVSQCLRHDAVAIWAHLIPIFEYLEAKAPQIETVFFISDSPSAQYRNRKMFFIMTCLHWNFPSLQCIEWNYTEHGHGKGAPDGVGGCLKSTADKIVARGKDIPDLPTLVAELQRHVDNVHIEEVDESSIFEKEMLVPENLPEFRATLKIHQVIWNSETGKNLEMRTLSCSNDQCLHKSTICQHGLHAGVYAAQPEDPSTKERKRKRSKKIDDGLRTKSLAKKDKKKGPITKNAKSKPPTKENTTKIKILQTTQKNRKAAIPTNNDLEQPSTSQKPEKRSECKDVQQEKRQKHNDESDMLPEDLLAGETFWENTSNIEALVTTSMADEIFTGLNIQDEDSDGLDNIF